MLLSISTDGAAQDLVKCEKSLTINSLPPAGAVVRKALAELPFTRKHYRKWKKRVRQSVLLPRIDLRYGTSERNFDRHGIVNTDRTRRGADGSIDWTESTYPDSISLDDGVRWGNQYGVLLSWDLSELVFHRDELQVAEIQRRLEDSRVKLIDHVTGYYSELQDSLIRLSKPKINKDNSEVGMETQKLRNLARLNALTDNFICEYAEPKSKQVQPTRRDTVPKRAPEPAIEKSSPYQYEPPKDANEKDPVFSYDEGALP
jgi:hypothetical protein